MMYPTIKIKTVNVELATVDKSTITDKLTPLSRLVATEGDVVFDVVVREVNRRLVGTKYCVSVRMSAGEKKYYAIAYAVYFKRAIKKVEQDLQRSVGQSHQVTALSSLPVRSLLVKRQSRGLFA